MRAIESSSGSRRPALEALTGLRFVAAMSVVLFHLPRAPEGVFNVFGWGYLGVTLFFVLSGFILTYTYVDAEVGRLRGSMRAFWWARVARIYPVYVLSLVLTLPLFLEQLRATALTNPMDHRAGVASLALAPALLQAWWPTTACQWNCPGWSLSVEAVFYALFPLVSVWVARKANRAWVTMAAAFALSLTLPPLVLHFAGPQSAADAFWQNALKFNPLVHLPGFVIGIASGLLFLRRGVDTRLSARWVGAAAVVGAAALLGVCVLVRPQESGMIGVFFHAGILAPLWAGIIVALALEGGVVGRALGSRPMVRLGEASYALYLTHQVTYSYLVVGVGSMRSMSPRMFSVVYLVVAVALSLVILTWIEEPARRGIRGWVRA